jgi:hypothetical protein
MVAKDLVEQNAYLTFQNMKIDSLDHIAVLDKAIEKNKNFPHWNKFKCII